MSKKKKVEEDDYALDDLIDYTSKKGKTSLKYFYIASYLKTIKEVQSACYSRCMERADRAFQVREKKK